MYRDLSQYIKERLLAIGETTPSISERLGWSQSYLYNIINGQYRPSRKRCIELAEQFGDDPNIILALANFYVPPDNDHTEFMELLNGLSETSRQAALDYLVFLKWKEDRSRD